MGCSLLLHSLERSAKMWNLSNVAFKFPLIVANGDKYYCEYKRQEVIFYFNHYYNSIIINLLDLKNKIITSQLC